MSTRRLRVASWLAVLAIATAPPWAISQEPPRQTAEPPGPRAAWPGAAILNPTPPFLVGVTVNHPDGRYREEDELSILVQSEQESHVYLIYHQADGTSRLLLPNVVNRQSRMRAKTPAVVPPPDMPGYRFVMCDPFGQEVLQAIASARAAADPRTARHARSRAPAIEPQKLTALEELLKKDPTSWAEHHVQVAVDPPAPPRKASRIGLFIGIGEYQDPKLCPTHVELGHSAEVMHDAMQRHGQLDPERTKLVLNQQATRANLQELFTKWLPSASEPGDFVFIYYSGHSGTYDTTDRTEPDGRDESICPYDITAGDEKLPLAERLRLSRQSDILDDTLGVWLQQLAGRQVVFVADTCHAGGLVQGKSATGKLAPTLGDEVKRIKDICGMNLLVLSCCGSDEQGSSSATSNQTMWFTMCLADLIAQDQEAPLSVQDAFGAAVARMKEVFARPMPAAYRCPRCSTRPCCR